MTRFFVSIKGCLLLEAFVTKWTDLVPLLGVNQAMFDQVSIGSKVGPTDVAAVWSDIQMDVIKMLLQAAPALLKVKRLVAAWH